MFVRDVGAWEDGGKGIDDPTGVGMRTPPASASTDVDGDKNGAFGQGRTPVKRGTLPNPVEGVPPIPKPPRRSMSEIASTSK